MNHTDQLIEAPQRPVLPRPDNPEQASIRELPGAMKELARAIEHMADANRAMELGGALGLLLGLIIGLLIGRWRSQQ